MDTADLSVLCLQVAQPSAESRWSTSSARLRKDPLIFLSRCARASNSRSSVLHCDRHKPRNIFSFSEVITTNYSESHLLSTKGNDHRFLFYVQWKGYKQKRFR